MRGLLFFALAASVQAEVLLLENFTLIDGSGRAPVSHAALLVRDGRIEYAGPKAGVKAPGDAKRMDCTGKFVMPGIINLHGHLGNVVGLTQDPKNYTRENVMNNLKTYASYGVTTVVSLGSDQPLILEIRRQQRAGRPSTTRVYTAYRGFTGAGGYPTSAPGMKGVPYEVSTVEQVKKAVAELADKQVDLIKIWVDDHFGKERKIPMDLSRAILDEARKRNLKVVAHIFYLEDARQLVEAGLAGLAHSIRDKPVDDAMIELMKRKGAWQMAATLTRELSAFVYAKPPQFLDDPFFLRAVSADVVRALKTPGQKVVASDPRFEAALTVAKKNLKRLADAGVRYGFGTDTGPPARFPGYFEHLEMKLMVEAGLTPAQVIQAATKNAAEFLGARDLGTLEKGKWADLLVLGKNPLENIENTRTLEQVYIAGNRVN